MTKNDQNDLMINKSIKNLVRVFHCYDVWFQNIKNLDENVYF